MAPKSVRPVQLRMVGDPDDVAEVKRLLDLLPALAQGQVDVNITQPPRPSRKVDGQVLQYGDVYLLADPPTTTATAGEPRPTPQRQLPSGRRRRLT
ncbi:hypothetical protein [Actinomadura flavalba]|uniref:hypothetical protein n=1 Tax=Actinomadura flavalba TaxID=1120938 RepID=UPI000371743D|nr:hypothetical protein [Actinomadura flavalba]